MRKGFQFKGKARLYQAGAIFDEGLQWVKSKRPQMNPRAAIIVTIEEIYSLGGGDNSGKRIA
jgi:uncharacterized protein